MYKVCTLVIFLCKIGDVIVSTCRETASTEGQAVMYVWNGIKECLYVAVAVENTR